MAAGGHFGCPKFTFDCISGHFRSIRNFVYEFFTKWPPAPIFEVRNSLSMAFLVILDRSVILDVWNSLSIAILAISDRYRTFFLFGGNFFFSAAKMAAGGHFGCPKITFDRISGHSRSIRNFFFMICFGKMAAAGHFGWDDNVNYRTRPRYLDE